MSIKSVETDEQCRELISQFRHGQISEERAREGIAELLSGSGVTRQVSQEWATRHHALTPGQQLNEDLQTEFDDLLFRKVTESGPDAFFNLDRAANSSVTGWARMTLRAARKSLLRNIHTRTTSRMELVSPLDPKDATSVTAAGYAYHTASSAEVDGDTPDAHDVNPLTQRMLIEQAAEWWSSRGATRRGARRTLAGAVAIRLAFNIPRPIRPDLPTRRRLQQLAAADPRAAHTSIRAMLACISRSSESRSMFLAADKDMMCLWDDFSVANLAALAERDPVVAHTLALEAIADLPRPSRTVIRKFRQQVIASGPASANPARNAWLPGWRSCANSACNAYLAEEFEAFSVMDTTGTDNHAEREAGRAISMDLAQGHYERAAGFKTSPLGATADQVRDRLAEIMDSVLQEEESNAA